MLNWADLGMLLATVFGGSFSAVCAAREHGAGRPVVVFLLLGLVVGAAIGIAGNKLSCAALDRAIAPKGRRETARNHAFDLLYLLIPPLSIAVAAGSTMLLTLGILSFVP